MSKHTAVTDCVTVDANAELDSLAQSLGTEEWGIVPVGRSGRLLWNRVAPEFARLVASPTLSAVVFVPPGVSATSSELWDAICEADPTAIRVLSSATLAKQVSHAWLPSLAPRKPVSVPQGVRSTFQSLSLGNSAEAKAVRAGVLQFWDQLEPSHQQSQAVEGARRRRAPDYWHAIMHRREPDYGNSKYWFRRVGSHDLFTDLADEASDILDCSLENSADDWARDLIDGGWDAFEFVDFCQETAANEDNPLGVAAREIQLAEMILLFAATLEDLNAV
ncbi:MAG: hypothetical protein R3C18_26875 [Planctomycetaceae bacterium]